MDNSLHFLSDKLMQEKAYKLKHWTIYCTFSSTNWCMKKSRTELLKKINSNIAHVTQGTAFPFHSKSNWIRSCSQFSFYFGPIQNQNGSKTRGNLLAQSCFMSLQKKRGKFLSKTDTFSLVIVILIELTQFHSDCDKDSELFL